jgi:hypothetical protein
VYIEETHNRCLFYLDTEEDMHAHLYNKIMNA